MDPSSSKNTVVLSWRVQWRNEEGFDVREYAVTVDAFLEIHFHGDELVPDKGNTATLTEEVLDMLRARTLNKVNAGAFRVARVYVTYHF